MSYRVGLLRIVCCFVVTTTTMKLPAVHALPGNDNPNMFNILQDVQSTVTDEYIEGYVKNCPGFRDAMFTRCQSRQFSCLGRCGQTIDYRFNTPHYNQELLAACSCDVLCQGFQDCCWDYHEQCGQVHRKDLDRWRNLVHVEKGCVDDVAVVTGCNSNDSNQWPGSSESTDLREPLVSETGVDLHFKNRHIYDCNKDALGLRNLTLWRIKLVSKDWQLIHDVPDFVHTGTLSETLREGMHYEPPKEIVPRQCLTNLVVDYRCKEFQGFCSDLHARREIENFTRVCNYLEHEQDASMQQGKDDDHDLLALDETTPHNDVKCYVLMRERFFGSKREDFVFSVVLDCHEIINLRIVEFKNTIHWDYINMNCSESGCRVTTKCKKGYVFLYGACSRPKEIQIITESKNQTMAETLMDMIIQVILVDNSTALTSSFGIEDMRPKDKGVYSLTKTYPIPAPFYLEHDGALEVVLAGHIINALREHLLELDTLDTESNATSCLIFEMLSKCATVFTNGVFADTQMRSSGRAESHDMEMANNLPENRADSTWMRMAYSYRLLMFCCSCQLLTLFAIRLQGHLFAIRI